MRKRIIIDVNILFSGLISGKIIYLELFDKFDFYLPDFAMAELQKYQVEILRKSTMAHEKLKPYTLALFERLVVVPNILVTTQSYLEGFYLCKDIDEDDTPYLAFSLELGMPLLSKDAILVNGLRNKGYENVFLLDEFMSDFLKNK
jgi:predicted nucleic acid-binding protein